MCPGYAPHIMTSTTPTTWNTFHPILMSKLSTPIPDGFKVAKGNSTRATALRPPGAKFNLHIPKDRQLRYVKWAPNLVPLGMEKLRSLHPDNTPASDPESTFWLSNGVNREVVRLRSRGIVTGEKEIQALMDQRILDPMCIIASRILFHLNDPPPGETAYLDLGKQTGDLGPPLWETVVKFPGQTNLLPIQTLIEGVIYALELKSLTVNPSSFFYRLCSRAAANVVSHGPIELKPFQDFQACTKGPKCRHANKRYTCTTGDIFSFFDELTRIPDFDPNAEELARLLSDLPVYNDDLGDKSGPIIGDDKAMLAKHPRVHVALAIMRTGAALPKENKDDDPDAQSKSPSMGTCSQKPALSLIAEAQKSQQNDGSKDCEDWKWEGGRSFDEHYTWILHQLWAEMLHRDLTFACLTTLEHSVMVYRSRSKQTLYVSTPFLPGATTPTFTQALLSQIICAYQEAIRRGSADGGDRDEDDEGDDSAPPRGKKRNCKEPEPGSRKRPRGDPPSDYDKIPVATLSTRKQLALAKSIEIGDVYMCVHDGFYDSTSTALLHPISHQSDSPRRAVSTAQKSSLTSSSSGPDSSMDNMKLTSITLQPPYSLCLTQRLGEGAVGEVWRGVLSPASGSSPVLDVVAKVGWTKGSRNSLINEAKIYGLLREKRINGVPVLIGLFDDVDDQVPILITTYAGDQICNPKASLKNQFRWIVHDLHKAGICHGDLRKENMCHLDGRASIIDFDRAFEAVDFSRDELDLEHVLARWG